MNGYESIRCLSDRQGRRIDLVRDKGKKNLQVMATILQKDFDGRSADLKQLMDHGSPYITAVNRVLASEKHIVIIMEFVQGYTLGQMMSFGFFITEKERRKWREELTQGLYYLHGLKPNPIFHGDIHPGNIIINSEKVAQFIDFSSIKSPVQKRPLQIHGVKEFMDPRVLAGEPYDGGADFYSLNKVFEVLEEAYEKSFIGVE